MAYIYIKYETCMSFFTLNLFQTKHTIKNILWFFLFWQHTICTLSFDNIVIGMYDSLNVYWHALVLIKRKPYITFVPWFNIIYVSVLNTSFMIEQHGENEAQFHYGIKIKCQQYIVRELNKNEASLYALFVLQHSFDTWRWQMAAIQVGELID
ncbi:hypothetical protein ACJX0J_019449 [Zea mays]